MDIVFTRRGYAFAGTLPETTWIKGDLKSINVRHEHLKVCRKTL